MLQARGLGKRYGGRWVFRGVEFDLAEGQAICVLGPNGSGKSTLLKVLAGLVSPTEGEVTPLDRCALGYAALDLALYPHLTAREHLELAATLRGLPAGAPNLLDEVGLGPSADRLVGQFSSGMRARLKLALAVQASPPVLLLDEPTVALDEAGRTLVDRVVESQLARGALVLATNDPLDRRYATHELVLAA